MYTYKTYGTCSRAINFDVDENNVLSEIEFVGGCRGNTLGVAKLAQGKNIDEVISLLEGIPCRGGTSCPDQLAQALKAYKLKKD